MKSVVTPYRFCLSTLPALCLLMCILLAGTGEYLQARLLLLGEFLWKDYYLLRGEISLPECDPDPNIQARLEALERQAQSQASDGLGLFEPEPFDRKSVQTSLENARDACKSQYEQVQALQERLTPAVEIYSGVEKSLAQLIAVALDLNRTFLLLLLLVCAATSTLNAHHITFRPVLSRLDHRVSHLMQLAGNLALGFSAWHYRESVLASGALVQHGHMLWVLLLGFVILSFLNMFELLRNNYVESRQYTEPRQQSFLKSLLTVPVYTWMAIVGGLYFVLSEGHLSGLMIFFSQLFEQSILFLKIGLYIWIGMMVKYTALGEKVFNLFKPWQLPGELLAVLALVLMAYPTAYTGASGIIIISLGAVVYRELIRSGARGSLALATTAMTGSSGVVLSPCLLVVLIAALNKEVVTAQLYDWGQWVFLLTVLVFLALVFMTRQNKFSIKPLSEALTPSLTALRQLLPYVLIFVLGALAYWILFDARLDEMTSPIILPIIVMILLYYEVSRDKQLKRGQRWTRFSRRVCGATEEATVHIGALLMLMGLSFAVGGVIERCGLIELLPHTFASTYWAMTACLLILVVLGMLMDPFGAVVLVSATLAPLAYANGIHPVHFWMVALVAFELGYLTPPVALNHLLTRQVVGQAALAEIKEPARCYREDTHPRQWKRSWVNIGFMAVWCRHEHILLPLVVMGAVLLLVAYGPLFFVSLP